jgi:hypothetical protein
LKDIKALPDRRTVITGIPHSIPVSVHLVPIHSSNKILIKFLIRTAFLYDAFVRDAKAGNITEAVLVKD